jgi:hypothetical protein
MPTGVLWMDSQSLHLPGLAIVPKTPNLSDSLRTPDPERYRLLVLVLYITSPVLSTHSHFSFFVNLNN